jgi:hypothetical protein
MSVARFLLLRQNSGPSFDITIFVGFAYQGKDIMFRFIVEYSSLRDFGP